MIEADYAQLQEDLGELNANWLDSKSLSSVEWDWDTVAIEPIADVANASDDYTSINRELTRPETEPLWWRKG